MKYCMVEVAFDNIDEVNKVNKILLDKKLVSSCQVINSDSIWNYTGIRENSHEYLVLMKTKDSMLRDIYDEIKKIHSYEVFEFAVFPFTSISDEYLNWIDCEVGD